MLRIATSLLVGLAALTASLPGQEAPATPDQDPRRYGREVPEGAAAVLGDQVISETLYIDELVSQQLRLGETGLQVLDSLVEEVLITQAMRRRGFELPTDEQVEEKISALDAQVREHGYEGGLKELLEKEEVPIATFRRKVRHVVSLERLARVELPVPEGQQVEEWQQKAWLKQAREGSKIRHAGEAGVQLPKGIVAVVNDEEIPSRKLAVELLQVLDDKAAVRPINVLIEEMVVNGLLAEHELKVDDEAITAEWEFRKRSFYSNPGMKGVPYEDILRERMGMTPEAFRASREFHIAAGRGLLARTIFSKEDIAAGFEEKGNLYGPVHVVAHLLIRATESKELQERGKVRSKEEGLERARFILGQIEKGVLFPDLVASYTDDHATAKSGGQLPRFTPGRHPFEHEFVNAAIQLEVGALSEPVWTRHGWHLIKLLERQPMTELTPAIEEDLCRHLLTDRIRARIQAGKVGFDCRL